MFFVDEYIILIFGTLSHCHRFYMSAQSIFVKCNLKVGLDVVNLNVTRHCDAVCYLCAKNVFCVVNVNFVDSSFEPTSTYYLRKFSIIVSILIIYLDVVFLYLHILRNTNKQFQIICWVIFTFNFARIEFNF